MSEPETEAGRALMRRLADMEAVMVDWAPAHSAPYLSRYIVEPIVEMGIRAVEDEVRRERDVIAEDEQSAHENEVRLEAGIAAAIAVLEHTSDHHATDARLTLAALIEGSDPASPDAHRIVEEFNRE